MQRASVTSSSIRSIGYDPVTAVLEIEFCEGHVYQYINVPHDIHQRLMMARSHGSFFTKAIRPAFRYVRVQ
jgi:hypothetical protein